MRNKIIYSSFLILLFFSCNNKEEKKHYKNQIGDTDFNPTLDDSNFKLCDTANVLHKRALVTYIGGTEALEKELTDNFKTKYQFSGYFVIRFIVNCKNESGRFRMEILDTSFKEVKCPEALKNQILDTFKNLKHWQHAIYNGKDYDCYKFLTLKMINGELIKS